MENVERRRRARNLVTRVDGKLVNVARKMGQLFVCASGCCCGHTEHGFAAVPADLYHAEWERRKLRPHVHLSMGGCLGPCPLANVIMLLFDGQAIWFHSINNESQVHTLYDYIEALVAAQTYLPPPPALTDFHFSAFSWDGEASREQLLALASEATLPGAAPRHAPQSRVGQPADADVHQGGIVFLTHADTDLLTVAKAVQRLGPEFPSVRAHNITHLKTETDARAFVDATTAGADLVILRLLGGSGSFRGGFERAVERARDHDQWLLCLPGTDALDPELTAASNVGAPVAHEAFAYLQLGGVKNAEHLLRFLADHLLTTGFGYDSPEPHPRHGVYYQTADDAPAMPSVAQALAALSQAVAPVAGAASEISLSPARGGEGRVRGQPRENALGAHGTAANVPLPSPAAQPSVGVLFYRSHLLSGNTAFVDALVHSLEERGAQVTAVYTASLQEYAPSDSSRATLTPNLPAALEYFVAGGESTVDVLITTTSFAVGDDPFVRLGIPVVQAIAASGRREPWAESSRGLSPTDVAMNVVIPELDGRIISVPISFKGSLVDVLAVDGGSEAPLYVPEPDRVARVVGIALRLAALRHKPNAEKRVAFLLTDYNAKASRVAAAVGLDTPASLVRILAAMRLQGYVVDDLPESGDALIQALVDRASYDREVVTAAQLAGAVAHVDRTTYETWFGELPPANAAAMTGQWGVPPGHYYVDAEQRLALAGLDLGNAFVAIQPPRGYGMDPAAIYHLPDLAPPHTYHALYRWLAEPQEAGGWGADAVVHVGKHGTLEWLPGKGVGLSAECYPDLFLRDLPLIYPFIINDPGEGAQAKRRAHAVIIDHLTPPMTTAEGYGELETLTRLIDEYYQLEALDPSKLPLLQQQIWELIKAARLDNDLGLLMNRDSATHTHEWDPQFHEDGVPYTISDLQARDFAHLVENINGYLCELTSAQIRDGLHILGQAPQGPQLIDTLFSLVRLPNLAVPSLRAGVAQQLGLDLDVILADLGKRVDARSEPLEARTGRALPTHADVLEAIDALGIELLAALTDRDFAVDAISQVIDSIIPAHPLRPLPLAAGALLNLPPLAGEGLLNSLPLAAEGPHGPLPLAGGGLGRGWTAHKGEQPELVRTLQFVCAELVPNLRRTDDEIGNLLLALDGRHVPAGPSGAPTRGMAQVLPTGRNFYTVDPRGLPSAAAWQVGQQLADELVARYQADEGRYPESVGISIWGTSLMRTHGDDVAEVMALIGVRPRWQAESRRLLDVEVISLEELGRPRVDVVCRISGFFRDAFPDLIAVLDRAFHLVGELDEPLEQNAIRRHLLAERARLEQAGLAPSDAQRRAGYRIFGSPPGAYGAGILPLIDERNWHDDADLAEVYVNWGGYAYGADDFGVDARNEFRAALAGVEAAVKNQDNREHDIFDSDDYFQYHGGMIAAIRSLGGKNPRRYFGDSADPQRARVRDLGEEALRVFRTRVVNPKWIASIQRHGYKGALELAATVDYLFGYDATANVVEDWMYERLTESYALDPALQEFFRQSNPWALRDLTSRLLEAMDRGLWHEPPPEMRQALQSVYLSADADVEARVQA